MYVSPKLIPNGHLLASASGAGNAVIVDSANMGTAAYTGPGAGRYATANSVVYFDNLYDNPKLLVYDIVISWLLYIVDSLFVLLLCWLRVGRIVNLKFKKRSFFVKKKTTTMLARFIS